MNRFTEIYIELIAAGYSYEEAEKLAKIKYEEEAVLSRATQTSKEMKAAKIKFMIEDDFRGNNLSVRVDVDSILVNDTFEFTVNYVSRKHRMFKICYILTYESIEKILNEDLSDYYEMLACLYGTILKMEKEV